MNYFNFEEISKEDAMILNPQVLAFVGDAVYTMYIRNMIVLNNKGKSGELHKITAKYVKAKTQSEAIEKLLPSLTQDEQDVFKRGRNYKTQSTAKNSSVQEYHRATGFEAVLGYLYLSGQQERLNELLKNSLGDDL
jgi:ribonuclease-3 family protein